MKNKWIKSTKCVFTPGGDPLWECENCGCGEHVCGIETQYAFRRFCPDCGSENYYPWEDENAKIH